MKQNRWPLVKRRCEGTYPSALVIRIKWSVLLPATYSIVHVCYNSWLKTFIFRVLRQLCFANVYLLFTFLLAGPDYGDLGMCNVDSPSLPHAFKTPHTCACISHTVLTWARVCKSMQLSDSFLALYYHVDAICWLLYVHVHSINWVSLCEI